MKDKASRFTSEIPSLKQLRKDLGKVAKDMRKVFKEAMETKTAKSTKAAAIKMRETAKKYAKEKKAQAGEKVRKAKHHEEEAGEQEPKHGEEETGELEARQGEEKVEEKEEGPGHEMLFDGTEDSFRKWKLVGTGEADESDGALCLEAGADWGLFYYHEGRFGDFRLRLHYKPDSPDCNMSFALRFLDPTRPVPDRDDPSKRYHYDNPAYVASHTGFAIQLGAQRPGGEPGTFADVLIGEAPGAQLHPERAEVNSEDWNELEVEVQGNCHSVRLNGKETSKFANVDPHRGKAPGDEEGAGHLGILMHEGGMRFRDIEIWELPEAGAEAPTKEGEEAREAD